MNVRKTTLTLFTFFIFLTLFTTNINAQEQDSTCGRTYNPGSPQIAACICSSGTVAFTPSSGMPQVCCGWVISIRGADGEVSDRCFSSPDLNEENIGQNTGNINITESITNETFDSLNPLIITGSDQADTLSTPGGIISRLLAFLFPIAGLILFVMIVWGGFEILMKSSDSKGMESGKNRITAAIVGFLLLFSSYWIVQIVEVVFGIAIL